MGPILAAIFVICNPDLLICDTPFSFIFPEGDVDVCREFVAEVVSNRFENGRIIMGECTWYLPGGEII